MKVVEESRKGVVEGVHQVDQTVMVIIVGVPSAVIEFNITDAMFDESARQEGTFAELAVAIKLVHHLGLFTQVKGNEVFAVHQADGVCVDVVVGAYGFGRILLMEGEVHHFSECEALTHFDLVD